MYLIFMYVGVSLAATFLSHRYLSAWVMSLYGQLPLHLMMMKRSIREEPLQPEPEPQQESEEQHEAEEDKLKEAKRAMT